MHLTWPFTSFSHYPEALCYFLTIGRERESSNHNDRVNKRRHEGGKLYNKVSSEFVSFPLSAQLLVNPPPNFKQRQKVKAKLLKNTY